MVIAKLFWIGKYCKTTLSNFQISVHLRVLKLDFVPKVSSIAHPKDVFWSSRFDIVDLTRPQLR